MRNAILFLAIVASMSAAVPAAGAECSTLGVWGDRGVVTDYALRGERLYAADGRGITIYDVANPAAIRQLFTARTAAPSRELAIVGDRIVVLTDGALELFAINGDSLSFLARAATAATRLAVEGGAIATAGRSVHLWRIAGDALTPYVEMPLDGPADALLIDEATLFVSQHDAGVAMFDISTTPATRGPTIAIASVDMLVANDHLYSASGGIGLQVVDLRNPTSPAVVATLMTGEVDFRSLAFNGTTLYATDALTASRVVAFAIETPSSPSVIATIDEPARVIASAGDRLYVSGFLRGKWSSTAESGAPVRIFEVTNTGSLLLGGEFADRGGPLSGAATDGRFAYVADPPLFRVISIETPWRPTEVARIPLDDFSDRVRLFGTLAVVYGLDDVHMIDVSNPRQPRFIGVFRSLGRPRSSVAMAGSYLIEANRASGLHVLDITNPARPHQTTGLKNDGWGEFYGVTALPDTGYGIVQRGVKVFDLRDKNKATVVRVLQAGHIVDAEVAPATGSHEALLVLIDATTLEVYSLRDPLNPVLASTLTLPESLDLAIDGDVVYVMSADHELLRIDIRDAARPAVTGRAAGFDAPIQIAAGGGGVVADTYSLKIVDDLSDAALPPVVPVLTVENATRRSATLSWSTGGGAYDVETSADEAFASPERMTVRTTRVNISLDAPRFARVRVSNACEPGPWSSSVRIDPASAQRVMFAERGQRVVVREGTDFVAVPVTVSNVSDGPVEVEIRRPDGATQVLAVSGGRNATVSITIAPSTLSAGAPIVFDLLDAGAVVDSHEVRVELVAPETSAATGGEYLVIPGVAAAKGRESTNWKSDLSILCRAVTPCGVSIDFVPFDATDRQRITLELRASESLLVDDVVGSVFGRDSATGSIELRGDPDTILASATTYNDLPGGRFGQRIPAQTVPSHTTATGAHRQLLGVESSLSSRTNIGLLNTSGVSQTLHLTLHDGGGSSTERDVTLAPHDSVQVAATDLLHLELIESGWIDVEGSNAVIAYASRVDQKTGDATFSFATTTGGEIAPAGFPAYVKVFDAVSSSMGEIGAVWRTAVQLVNPNAHEVDATLTLVPGSDPSKAVSKTVHLGANAAVTWDDVFAGMFGDIVPELSAIGSLRVTASSPLAGWARIYNTTPAGTYGQYVPLRDASPSRIATGVSPAWLGKIAVPLVERLAVMTPLAADAARRTNVGLTEVAGKPVIVQLNVYDRTGALIATKDLYVTALGSILAQRLLDELQLTGLTGVRIEVQRVAGEGVVHAYASVVENATGDAVFIPAE